LLLPPLGPLRVSK